MPGAHLSDEEQATILSLYTQSMKKKYGLKTTYHYIARCTGRDERTIRRVIKSLIPTTQLATAKLQAASSKLVDRLIAKAEVPDILDILTRPNIGVLAPMNKGATPEQVGVFVSVQADSCAAVKLGVLAGPALPGPDAESPDIIEVSGEDYNAEEERDSGPDEGPLGRGEGRDAVLSRARAKLQLARTTVHEEDGPRGPERGRRERPEDEGLQKSDEQSEDPDPQTPVSRRGPARRQPPKTARRVLTTA